MKLSFINGYVNSVISFKIINNYNYSCNQFTKQSTLLYNTVNKLIYLLENHILLSCNILILIIQLCRLCNENPEPSGNWNHRARKYGKTVRKTWLRASLKSYRAIKQPNRNDKQNSAAIKKTLWWYLDKIWRLHFDGRWNMLNWILNSFQTQSIILQRSVGMPV